MAASRLPMPSPWIVVVAAMLCAFGWAWTLAAERANSGDTISIPAFCGEWIARAPWRDGASLDQWLMLNPPGPLALAWLGMLLAMMPPLLLQPAAYLWQRSLSRRRWRAIAIFATAYGAVWMLAGAAVLVAALALQAAAGGHIVALGIVGFALALLWQAAPARQRALNGCHHQPRLSAFGWRADRDVLRYAATHASWCIAACWAWMLLPLLVGPAHLPAMLAVTCLLALERMRPARPARWRWPLQEAKELRDMLQDTVLRPRRGRSLGLSAGTARG